MTTYYSKLSRRFRDNWRGNVTKYDAGKIEVTRSADTGTGKRLILPDLPKDSKPRGTRQKKKNQAQVHNQPWTLGLVEAIDAVDLLERSQLETKNRIALILLDSNFEIALKEFIVHRKDLFPAHEFTDTKLVNLFKSRTDVIKTVASKISISPEIMKFASH